MEEAKIIKADREAAESFFEGPCTQGILESLFAYHRIAHTPQPDAGNEDDEVIGHFAMLYREYGLADDATLAPCALALKAKVLAALRPT